MTKEQFYLAGGFYLQAHGITSFVAAEVAPVGRLANGRGPALLAPPAHLMRNALLLTERVLLWVRNLGGASPVHVSSWYRDPAYNRAVGGASASIHLTCGASDIRKDGMTPRELALRLHREHPDRQRLGIGLYPTFTHVDVRGLMGLTAPARWGTVGNWWL